MRQATEPQRDRLATDLQTGGTDELLTDTVDDSPNRFKKKKKKKKKATEVATYQRHV